VTFEQRSTQTAKGVNNGITWPSQPGYYYFRVESTDVSPMVRQYAYFEVYGDDWTTCTFRSTVTHQG